MCPVDSESVGREKAVCPRRRSVCVAVSVREFHEAGSHVLFITSVERETVSAGTNGLQLFSYLRFGPAVSLLNSLAKWRETSSYGVTVPRYFITGARARSMPSERVVRGSPDSTLHRNLFNSNIRGFHVQQRSSRP